MVWPYSANPFTPPSATYPGINPGQKQPPDNPTDIFTLQYRPIPYRPLNHQKIVVVYNSNAGVSWSDSVTDVYISRRNLNPAHKLSWDFGTNLITWNPGAAGLFAFLDALATYVINNDIEGIIMSGGTPRDVRLQPNPTNGVGTTDLPLQKVAGACIIAQDFGQPPYASANGPSTPPGSNYWPRWEGPVVRDPALHHVWSYGLGKYGRTLYFNTPEVPDVADAFYIQAPGEVNYYNATQFMFRPTGKLGPFIGNDSPWTTETEDLILDFIDRGARNEKDDWQVKTQRLPIWVGVSSRLPPIYLKMDEPAAAGYYARLLGLTVKNIQEINEALNYDLASVHFPKAEADLLLDFSFDPDALIENDRFKREPAWAYFGQAFRNVNHTEEDHWSGVRFLPGAWGVSGTSASIELTERIQFEGGLGGYGNNNEPAAYDLQCQFDLMFFCMHGLSLMEADMHSVAFNLWRGGVYGDPLYRPFGRFPLKMKVAA